MQCYLFTDLDDTLFQTLRKCPAQGADAASGDASLEPHGGLTVASLSRQGEALSYMTAKQRALLDLFSKAHIIPVTARNADAFGRVCLHFAHGAVLNYGGTVLDSQGKEDMAWTSAVRHSLAPWQEALQHLLQALNHWTKQNNMPVRTRIIGHEGCNFYVVCKNIQAENCALHAMRLAGQSLLREVGPHHHQWTTPQWYVHHNDNNLAFIPKALNKAHAVQHIMQSRLRPLGQDFFTLGMGDSLVDLDFMQLCDYAIIPHASQIQRVSSEHDFFRQL